MKIGMLAVIGAASIATAVNAGFVGWVGKVRNTGTHYIMDIYAGMSSPTDTLLNVFNMNVAATNGSVFIQGSTATTNKWRPTLGVATIDDIDSFVTLGGFDDGGTYYCGDTTTGDPSFTNYATANATTIAPNAGWFANDPTSPQIAATLLGAMPGQVSASSEAAEYGVWVAHLVTLRDEASNNGSVTISGSAAFNTGTNAFDARTIYWTLAPAPGALALLGAAGLAPRRRRG